MNSEAQDGSSELSAQENRRPVQFPNAVFYEPEALKFPLGRLLKDKYADREWIAVKSHNSIEEMQRKENREFPRMKQALIVGIRKTHKYVENQKVSEFLVPWTSSGCSAMCLYCYLVCSYNKCAYLRVFVNREEMMDTLVKTSLNTESPSRLKSEATAILSWRIRLLKIYRGLSKNLPDGERGPLPFPRSLIWSIV